MVPTSCSGRSVCSALRRRAPAVSGVCDISDLARRKAVIVYTRPRRGPMPPRAILPAGRTKLLGLSGDTHHRAPGDLPFQIGGEGLRQLIEVDGAAHDARQMPRL